MPISTDEALDRGPEIEQFDPHLRTRVNPSGEFPMFRGRDPFFQEIDSKIDLIARSNVPVFVTGESGTGKEVVARMIHQKSGKSPFIAINCAALPKDVIENELFGHEKGAFTGALLKKSGCFELAHGGTLFLDEIAEMHPQTQAKLLRAIETSSFRRLGGRDEVYCDVRIIAATNKDPMVAMKNGLLREDLFYRLSVIEIGIPSLRERKADIEPLLKHFMFHLSAKYGRSPKRFSPEVFAALHSFAWRGNVRELKNLVERLVLICPEEEVRMHHLPERMREGSAEEILVHIPLGTSIDKAEEILITETLGYVNENKAKAARVLGISRKALYDKLKQYKSLVRKGEKGS